jgi:hypothetical protein
MGQLVLLMLLSVFIGGSHSLATRVAQTSGWVRLRYAEANTGASVSHLCFGDNLAAETPNLFED